ncbi:kinase-like domain-containing protein [Suillus clintonianus]|uniref:kinase-like domain-containing protein n=1 Tax=Suillus clintonianus TaxID=1904413 RepID=UPI001B873EE5|nr:kinase-like domain-containing protein [Suillus clintonianus]KAG2141005.1 kinase-like domain-containing protein [Suillus clintonianus]
MFYNLTDYISKDQTYAAFCGGFGDVWKCTLHIPNTKKIKVAVKALRGCMSDAPDVVKKKNTRIAHELKICANLSHLNILPVYGVTDGFSPHIAIVSRWAENGNLTAYLGVSGDLTLVRRFQMLRDIIAGLRYLHANKIIHGDLTGPNVLIYADGTACLADFGLSLMYSDVISPSQASWTSTFKGNMRWMAPERLLGNVDGSVVKPTEQSDVFSFGGIMLQVLTNDVPYYYINGPAIQSLIIQSKTPSRSQYSLNEKYWSLIEPCWSTRPWDRPSPAAIDGAIRNELLALHATTRT